jgi:hypothetical protein
VLYRDKIVLVIRLVIFKKKKKKKKESILTISFCVPQFPEMEECEQLEPLYNSLIFAKCLLCECFRLCEVSAIDALLCKIYVVVRKVKYSQRVEISLENISYYKINELTLNPRIQIFIQFVDVKHWLQITTLE